MSLWGCVPLPCLWIMNSTSERVISMLWQWIIRIALWTLAGYLGSRIMKDGTPNGWLGNIVLGWIGGLIGNFAFRLIGLGSRGIVGEILVSVVGACLVIWLVRKFNLGRWFDK